MLSLDGSSLVFTNTTFTYLKEEEEGGGRRGEEDEEEEKEEEEEVEVKRV